MKMERDIRGTAAVGHLTELAPWEAELIMAVRLWQDGPRGQSQVWSSYAHAFGSKAARAHLRTFERLLVLIDTNMMRPFVRYGVACNCIGSDEAVFANLVRMASEGDLHEASVIATLLVRATFAEHVALLAAEVGGDMREVAQDQSAERDRVTDTPIRLH